MQQKLRDLLSINGAGFVRYLYGAPAAAALLIAALGITGGAWPSVSPRMLVFAAAGGASQIFATNLLIMAFGFRNFAVGTAYSKTETAQSGIIALIVLHETLRPIAWAGISVGLVGVLTLSLVGRGFRPRALAQATVQPAALAGLGAGFCFAVTIVFIKLASQAVSGPSVLVRAMFVLFVTNTLQTLMQGAYLAVREPHELRKVLTSWRSSAWVGVLSAAGSACWFTGFTLTDVALVRAVGQIEVVFTLLFSRFYLKERLRPGDARGLMLVVGGVLLIVIGSR
ncbi:MAG: DMT family transporter [Pseudomonadota bacterium]|nr:DMT family transporter [Pseudomonadota bacterium]